MPTEEGVQHLRGTWWACRILQKGIFQFLASIIFAVFTIWAGEALALEAGQISFLHQENVEPWESAACQHKLSPIGLFEWDVVCVKNGRYLKYGVHLVLNRYPRTRPGGAGYELLYWVTDWTDPAHPKSTSTTLFMHLATEEDHALLMEGATGIDNDLASLRLTIDLRAH